jgi:hypothetical protein
MFCLRTQPPAISRTIPIYVSSTSVARSALATEVRSKQTISTDFRERIIADVKKVFFQWFGTIEDKNLTVHLLNSSKEEVLDGGKSDDIDSIRIDLSMSHLLGWNTHMVERVKILELNLDESLKEKERIKHQNKLADLVSRVYYLIAKDNDQPSWQALKWEINYDKCNGQKKVDASFAKILNLEQSNITDGYLQTLKPLKDGRNTESHSDCIEADEARDAVRQYCGIVFEDDDIKKAEYHEAFEVVISALYRL